MVVAADWIDVALTVVHYKGSYLLISIELLRSTDHGATWSHVSTLLDGSLAGSECGSADAFSAADLFYSGGNEYLIASVGPIQPGATWAYDACLVYRVADPVAGALQTDGSGNPVVLRRITAADPRYMGGCTYAEGATCAGYLGTEQYPTNAPISRIYQTHLHAP